MEESADIIVVGAGPAGLAVADHLQRAGHTVILLEKGCVAGAIADFPTFMTFFSTKDLLEIGGFPLTIAAEKPTRREYLGYLSRFVRDRALDVRPQHTVESIRPTPGRAPGQPGAFEVATQSPQTGARQWTSRYVVLATGAWDQPNMLGIPGEKLPKVSHRYREAHPYVGRRVMVVGGRNSAVEIALELWRAGAARVDLSYRGTAIDGHGIKYWLVPDIQNRLAKGEVGNHLGTVPVRFEADRVVLRRVAAVEGGQGAVDEEYDVPNDYVVCMTGYSPDLALLRTIGVEVDPATKIPVHNKETYESSVPGLFLAGVMLQGDMSGHIFIENSRHHGANILRGIEEHQRMSATRTLPRHEAIAEE